MAEQRDYTELYERQLELERAYTDKGVALALENWERMAAAGNSPDHYIGRCISLKLYSVVKDALEKLCVETRGVGGKYRILIRTVGFDKAAVILLREALSASTKLDRVPTGIPPRAQDIISSTGSQMQLQYMHDRLTEANPGYMYVMEDAIKNKPKSTRGAGYRDKAIKRGAKNILGAGYTEITWSTAEKNGVGALLLRVAVECGVLELKHVRASRGRTVVCVLLAPDVQGHMTSMIKNLRVFQRFPPMLVPPCPHTRDTLFRGASYLTTEMAEQTSTIHARRLQGADRDWVKANISDAVLEVGNKAAQQPYIINTVLVELLRDLYQQGMHNGICGIPDNNPITGPLYPLPDGWDREDPTLVTQHKEWKLQRKAAYLAEAYRQASNLKFSMMLKYLDEFRGDVLHFPTFFDWRGRLYFHSNINPQGTDFIKASLSFANTKPLGPRGLYWLKVHVATCYGFDKASFDRRANWVDGNMQMIQDAVQYHVDSDFFRAADSPWCFWVAAKDMLGAVASGNPETWETAIPVAMDATASGLQILSAVARDPVGGMFTNLLPNGGHEKEDIYAAVAGIAISNIQRDTENPEQAKYWLDHGIPRSMAKKPVMIFPYGGTLTGCMEYVYLDMKERGMEPTESHSLYQLSGYLAKYLMDAVASTVPAASVLMKFLRGLTRLMPDTAAMRWLSPCGFPVVQHYPKEESVRLSLEALGIQLIMRTFNDKVMQRSKVSSGIAPNFTHSLDSAHMCMAVGEFEHSVLPIHDSFATHPCDVDRLHTVLRDTFVRLHSESNTLLRLVQYVQQHTDTVIELPETGNLDLGKVRESLFFMC